MNWDERLRSWTGPASDTEDDKQERTEARIRQALREHPEIPSSELRVYAKGSYANNTNVRLDSDVDIAVEYTGGMYTSYSDGVLEEATGLSPYTGPFPTFNDFKTTVQRALVAAFGSGPVERRNKCIAVEGSGTTLDADVVPCWTYRHYYTNTSYTQGTAFFSDDRPSRRIENYPQQHYDNGVKKNTRTHRRYKGVVRALKRLENEMVDKGATDAVPSYLIECLVYRCPDRIFGYSNHLSIAQDVLATIYKGTEGREPDNENDRWLEVNDIKFLFHFEQKWTRQQANRFALDAWSYLGLDR